ncbi:MAG: tRNA (adenosine(37)-N6)-threonylcarbamoyltransferase complex transferase subunit TsaD [Planctomycetota bacterium]|nr:tRNA (adenosine(37)-N6)-threonylcarbamoyltransferase complex transferase subunit TsaD [Planctomycetota bacterium]
MKILGIETSCDETCAAVVLDGRRVLSSIVATQIEIHRKYGGVVPEIASRAHIEALVPVVAEALQEARTPADALDAVAVVHRPGLIGSLLLGLSAAKTLAWLRGVPLVGVNHIEGHIYAACLERDALPFPCVSLIVSGGHTSLYRSEGPADHRLLGATTDDAAGEAFDKVASILGLEYPGGPSVDRAAEGGNPKAVTFPRSWLGPDSFDFSFSGLKTAVLYHVRGKGAEAKRRATLLAPEETADVAASFQEAVVDVLVTKTLRAAEASGVDRVIVGGGVAANRRLRARLQEEAGRAGIEVLLPAMRFCTDNAAMVAGLAYHYARAGRFADLDLEARAD